MGGASQNAFVERGRQCAARRATSAPSTMSPPARARHACAPLHYCVVGHCFPMAFAQLSRPAAPPAARPAPATARRAPPPRFSRLVASAGRDNDRFESVFTSRSEAALAYVCADCGFIYTDARPFEKLPSSYKCPSCKAPKARFVEKDVSAATALPLQLAAVAALAAAAAYAVQQL